MSLRGKMISVPMLVAIATVAALLFATTKSRAIANSERVQIHVKLEAARQEIKNAQIPEKLRERLLERIDGITSTVEGRLQPASGSVEPSEVSAARVSSDPVPSSSAVATAPTSAPAISAPAIAAPPRVDSTVQWIVICVLAAALVVGTISILYHLKVLVPRRRRRPLVEALTLLHAVHEEPAACEQIEMLLNKALTNGLPDTDLPTARFALAYIRARMGKLADARVAALEIDNASADAEVHYLRLWLHAQLKDHRAAIEVWEQRRAQLGNFHDSKQIAAVAYLTEALALWRREQVDGAVTYFKAVAELGADELAQFVPRHIDQHQIVQGIRALHNGRFQDARKSFESARGANLAGDVALAAEVGLLLCEWREGGTPDVDDRVRELADRYRELLSANSDAEEHRRLLVGLLLWHAVSWLFFVRGRRAAKSGLPEQEQRELRSRLARVIEIDSELPDPKLIGSLIDYFFEPEKRALAVEALKAVSETAVQVPEVAEIVRKEQRLKRSLEEGLSSYLRLGRTYLASPHVPVERRKALRSYLERFAQFKALDPIDEAEANAVASPSVAQLDARVRDMRAKVERVVRPKAGEHPAAHKSIEDRLKALDATTKELLAKAESVEFAEQELMLSAGEFFIEEEAKP